ncbi:DUF2627 domain-containing protein [Brevibacillus dissolubilis]|uniref:DUF2627 domain-containing protein n=1 Tax=Brevibacillus dissolubilis TaxID=1844116 RepID=UPI0011171FA9|nr:DUF2627 domain-containing protein [Brevibacillus dissolubilis]
MLGQKIVALLIMVIPAAIAMYGVKLIRDAFYAYFNPDVQTILYGDIMLGLVLFIVPVLFIGGFVLHHDRKRNRVQPRFMKRDPEDDDDED